MPVSPLQLLRYVLDDDLDAAIRAGLMDYRFDPHHAHLDPNYPQLLQLLLQTQQRLRKAWAARERYRARQARLQRREMQQKRQRSSILPTVAAKPALPTAAAAILAKAKARAAAQSSA